NADESRRKLAYGLPNAAYSCESNADESRRKLAYGLPNAAYFMQTYIKIPNYPSSGHRKPLFLSVKYR
ncbi:hypothetical protein, partial [Prevotella multiformis]|uniref:hypothetical protein n=1 Tax=Prevotella multiformis TaxID=282402 RepID=UPI0028DB0436